MLLLGVVVALIFSIQMDLLPDQKQRIVGGLLWLSVFFAGATVFDRSFAAEREDGCWDGMKLLPVSPGTVYLAKLTVNVLAVAALECLLVPMFFRAVGPAVARARSPDGVDCRAGESRLGGRGDASQRLAAGSGKSGSLLVLVVLPLVIPVLLAAAECTRLVVENRIDDQWWRWIQLLGAFAIVFVTAGTLLFEYAIED